MPVYQIKIWFLKSADGIHFEVQFANFLQLSRAQTVNIKAGEGYRLDGTWQKISAKVLNFLFLREGAKRAEGFC